jgi:hypothetical protein
MYVCMYVCMNVFFYVLMFANVCTIMSPRSGSSTQRTKPTCSLQGLLLPAALFGLLRQLHSQLLNHVAEIFSLARDGLKLAHSAFFALSSKLQVVLQSMSALPQLPDLCFQVSRYSFQAWCA